MPVVGSRFLIEAGFIIAVALVAGIERLSTWWIIVVVAAAWIIVAAVEIAVWGRQAVRRQPVETDRFEPMLEQPAPRSSTILPPELAAEPEPEPEAEREPAAVSTPPRIVAVPSPPEPEPAAAEAPPPAEPERPAEPEPARVLAFTPANVAPRQWNLWELERAARDHSGDDVQRAEERSYLLVYLREFAGPDGILPTDFDGLVRDAFGDLLHAVGA